MKEIIINSFIIFSLVTTGFIGVLTFEGVITKIQELEEKAVRKILEHGTQHHD